MGVVEDGRFANTGQVIERVAPKASRQPVVVGALVAWPP